jgi:hypothetical protein
VPPAIERMCRDEGIEGMCTGGVVPPAIELMCWDEGIEGMCFLL